MKRFALIAASAALVAGCADKPETEVREELRSMTFKCDMYKPDTTEVSGEVKYAKFDFVNNQFGVSDSADGNYEIAPSEIPNVAAVIGVVGSDEGRVFYTLQGEVSGHIVKSTTFVDRFSGRLGMVVESETEGLVPSGLEHFMAECELAHEDRVNNKAKF